MPARQPRAENRALEPTPIAQASDEVRELRELLMTSVVLLGAFRRRLRDAGYPFREPPAVEALIARADRALYPEEAKRA